MQNLNTDLELLLYDGKIISGESTTKVCCRYTMLLAYNALNKTFGQFTIGDATRKAT